MPTTRTTATKKSATKKTATKKATVKKAAAKKPSSPRFKKAQVAKVKPEKKIGPTEEASLAPVAQSSSDFLGPRQQVVITPISSEYVPEGDTPPSNRPSSIADQLDALTAKQSPVVLPVEEEGLEVAWVSNGDESVLEDQQLEVPVEAPAQPRKRVRGTLAFIALLSLLGVGSAALTYYLFQLLA